MSRIGYKIREKRRQLKLTQGDLARLCGVTYPTIGTLENTDVGNVKTLIAVCDALNLNIELTDK